MPRQSHPAAFASDAPLSSRSARSRARRYFRAVFTSMPAFDAAISCVSSMFDNLYSLLICWSVTIRKALSWNAFRIVSTHFK